jgi:hypothetical protein
VFLPNVCDESWLLWSKRGNKVRLRRYSSKGYKVIEELTVPDAERLTLQPKSKTDQLPCYNNISLTEHSFWRLVIESLNVRDGLVEHEDKDRLLAVFKLQCREPLQNGDTQQLKALFQSWTSRFSKLKSKGETLNPYDGKDANGRFKPKEGKSWQAAMLEWSRKDGRIQYVDTGSSETTFSFAIMELTLAIPSAKNPFFPGSESRIAPDGLGVRRNGFLTVIEVKGPDDDRDLLGPLLQATCGALAVVATKEWLCSALRTQHQLRPAYKNARVPKRSSIELKRFPDNEPLFELRRRLRFTPQAVYCLCFTDSERNERMWHEYADQCRGVVLEVDNLKIKKCVSQICYDEPDQRKKAVELVQKVAGAGRELHDWIGAVNEAFAAVCFAAPDYKESKWCHEREWRAVAKSAVDSLDGKEPLHKQLTKPLGVLRLDAYDRGSSKVPCAFIDAPDDAFLHVYVGPQCSAVDRRELEVLLADRRIPASKVSL